MSLQDLIAADALALLANGDWDEAIVVTFPNGTTRSIRGWISRQPPEQYQGVPAPLMEVRVPIDATTGLLPSEVDFGGIRFSVPRNPGETPKPFNVFRPNDGKPFIGDGVIRVNLR